MNPSPAPKEKAEAENKKPKTRYIKQWDEVGWVVKIFFWFVIERKSLRWIARELNRLGAPKDHRATRPHWHHQQVAGVLSNRKYIGSSSWGENKNIHDPMNHNKIRQEKRSVAETEKWLRHFPDLQIIDDDTFAKAQKHLADNAEQHTNRRHKNGQLHGSSSELHAAYPRHPLSGLVECQCCRKLNVGGTRGKYLFCRGYGMGVCTCQTTLNRELAERLIYDAIGKQIASNPSWVELLLNAATRSYEELMRELPTQRRILEEALADVQARIKMLVANSEKEIVPELEARMRELRAEREQLQSELKALERDEDPAGPPTWESISEKLGQLPTRVEHIEHPEKVEQELLAMGE